MKLVCHVSTCQISVVHELLEVPSKGHFPCKLLQWFNLNNLIEVQRGKIIQ